MEVEENRKEMFYFLCVNYSSNLKNKRKRVNKTLRKEMEHTSEILLLFFFAFLVFMGSGLIAIMVESEPVRNLSCVLI